MPALDLNKNKTSSATAEKTIADILYKQKALTDDQLEKINDEAVSSGQSLEQLIEEKQLVPEVALAKAKADFYKIPYVSLEEKGISPTALNLIPRLVSERYHLVPFEYNVHENELSVAMADPFNLEAIDFVEKKSQTKVKSFFASYGSIKHAIEEGYAQGLTTEVKEALGESTVPITKTIDIKRLGEVIREAPIAKIVAKVLEFALKSRSSDVHIEPEETRTRVRYRIDGILHEKLLLPAKFHDAVISRIKILSGMKIDEKRIPQDGRFTFEADGKEVDLRVSTIPTINGEKIVMRLLRKFGGVPSLTDLGLRGKALKDVEEDITKPYGIVLVCGPTGSGKTTTLYSVLSKINSTRVNIVTLEDPVEYEIPGINQVQVNRPAGLTFASGLRSFLRQDPNIIMVGEIRDEETTDLAIQAALTGHLVFSTLHTNTASGALPRLLDLKAEPFLLTSSINCIMGQRVCRKICLQCKKKYQPAPEIIEDLKKSLGKLLDPKKELMFYHGEGCEECGNTGYMERVGIFEVLPVTAKIGKMILERSPALAIEQVAVEEGMITMKRDGFLKVVEGITTIDEVLRVAHD